MATLYKEGVEGKYKWLTPKQAKKYGIPPEYKLMEETVLSHLAKILQKTGAKPSAVYSLFTDETGCKRITALCFGIKDGKEGHERLRKYIDFLDEIDAAIEEGDMSQAHQLVGDWRKELDDYLALNEKECGTHDDGAGDEAAVAKTKE